MCLWRQGWSGAALRADQLSTTCGGGETVRRRHNLENKPFRPSCDPRCAPWTSNVYDSPSTTTMVGRRVVVTILKPSDVTTLNKILMNEIQEFTLIVSRMGLKTILANIKSLAVVSARTTQICMLVHGILAASAVPAGWARLPACTRGSVPPENGRYCGCSGSPD